jgi:hypothetical protein
MMISHDAAGLAVGSGNPVAVAACDRALALFNRYAMDPVAELDRALAADPHFAMAHALKGALFASATDATLLPMVRAMVVQGRACPRVTPREQAHLDAVELWAAGDFTGAVDTWGHICAMHPRDLAALQMAHLGDLYLGRPDRLRDRPAAALAAQPQGSAARGIVLGMYAFGLEECGDYEGAETAARAALAAERRDVWAVHALSHVFEMQGRVDEGLAFLGTDTDIWAIDNMFARHVWWHLALFHIANGDAQAALDLYDRHMAGKATAIPPELVDAASLLWRLQLVGVEGGARWHALADQWMPTIGHAHYAFNDLHAAMALCGAGRRAAAQQLITQMTKGGGSNAEVARSVGAAACRGLLLHATGDHAAARDVLHEVLPLSIRLGGSNAQRDLLRLTAEASARAA